MHCFLSRQTSKTTRGVATTQTGVMSTGRHTDTILLCRTRLVPPHYPTVKCLRQHGPRVCTPRNTSVHTTSHRRARAMTKRITSLLTRRPFKVLPPRPISQNGDSSNCQYTTDLERHRRGFLLCSNFLRFFQRYFIFFTSPRITHLS